MEGFACPSDPRSSVVWGPDGASHGKQVLGEGPEVTSMVPSTESTFPGRGLMGPLVEADLGAGHGSERLVTEHLPMGSGRVQPKGRDLGGLIAGCRSFSCSSFCFILPDLYNFGQTFSLMRQS